jgi:hypothetical protein
MTADDPPLGESQAKSLILIRSLTDNPVANISLSLTVIPCRPIVMWKPSMPIVSDNGGLREVQPQAPEECRCRDKSAAANRSSQLTATS